MPVVTTHLFEKHLRQRSHRVGVGVRLACCLTFGPLEQLVERRLVLVIGRCGLLLSAAHLLRSSLSVCSLLLLASVSARCSGRDKFGELCLISFGPKSRAPEHQSWLQVAQRSLHSTYGYKCMITNTIKSCRRDRRSRSTPSRRKICSRFVMATPYVCTPLFDANVSLPSFASSGLNKAAENTTKIFSILCRQGFAINFVFINLNTFSFKLVLQNNFFPLRSIK